ncbi:MAG: 4-(cytidine 5'-diphospho)-2-C-methyl-D-erythritol kinase, partial [Planctomycetaceae bacterium]|nr:4-(cytidine 5'-diphospho)-2-C-methyl-D-erythritol kinase [Planctomycetaceae bacterium]
MVVEAPAKINWFLEVLRKRDDGFHEILTVMQTIAWRDRLTFAPRNDGRIEFTTDAPGLPRDERNLVVKAALALQSASNKVFGATIHLEKCIPTGAGLGGGSSDAATTLMALNDLWNLDYDSNRLTQIASTLGSDIPFFLYGPLARCGGRGEIVSKMSNARTVPMVVVWPGVEVPSATIYRSGLIDLTSPREKCNFSYDLLAAGQGVCRFDAVTGRVKRLAAVAADTTRISSDEGTRIYADRNGTVWYGTLSGTVDRIDERSGLVRRLAYGETGNAAVRAFAEGEQGNM